MVSKQDKNQLHRPCKINLLLSWQPVSCDCHMAPQGVIYSETAAANYPDPDMFNRNLHIIPARRLGYPEEVSILDLASLSTSFHSLSFSILTPFLSTISPSLFPPFISLPPSLSLSPSLPLSLSPLFSLRCLQLCVFSSLLVLRTLLAVQFLWMVGRGYIGLPG